MSRAQSMAESTKNGEKKRRARLICAAGFLLRRMARLLCKRAGVLPECGNAETVLQRMADAVHYSQSNIAFCAI